METTEEEVTVQQVAAEKSSAENWPVIVAEGDKARRLAMLSWLKDWAYTALPAVNGEHALELLRQPGGTTLALVGQKLRGLDGPGLCRKIKRRRSTRTYVLLLTGKGREQEVADGLEAGADDCLQEPFRASELQMRLRAGQRILQL
jgi:DNA-binding response OmpR family regulator